MTEFLSFFIVLVVAVFFSALFGRLHVPWVITLVGGGMLVGPFGLNWFEPNDTISFLGEIGLVFLMFMAGLETRVGRLKERWQDVSVVVVLNGFLPAIVGVALGIWLGYRVQTALLLGIIFVSTSIAIVIPSLQANGFLGTRVGQTIITATVVEDIASLFLLSWVLQTVAPVATVPLWILYPTLGFLLWALRFLLPRLQKITAIGLQGKQDLFQQELRFVFVLLLGVVVFFEVLGLHTIIAGFLAGLVLSDVLKNPVLLGKVRALGYGLFIPVFFVLVGARTDLSVFREAEDLFWLTLIVVIASIGSKLVGGLIAGRLRKFSRWQSVLIGVATVPQLTTTLAVAFIGADLGLIDEKLLTTLVVLSVLTTFAGPMLIRLVAKKAIVDKKMVPAAAMHK